MVGVGRDLCRSSSPTLLPKQGHLEQAAQDLVQVRLRRLHNLPEQPISSAPSPSEGRSSSSCSDGTSCASICAHCPLSCRWAPLKRVYLNLKLFYYQLTANPFSALQLASIFATLNILLSSANSSVPLLPPTAPCCFYGKLNTTGPSTEPCGAPLVIFHHCRNSWFTLFSSLWNHLCIPGHSPLQHDCLVLGFWWVTLSGLLGDIRCVSFTCVCWSLQRTQVLSKSGLRSLKADCIYLTVH